MRPRLYGLPKLHKPDIPLRPILSMVNSPQHGLAKFLNAMLEPVIAYFARFIVKDSFEVVRRIRSVGAESTFVSSFDVKKLFSNVPLDEVISTSTDMLYSLQKPSIKKENFMKLLRIATSEVQFSFDGMVYSQVDGVAMGSPLGPTLANIFMGHLEYKVIPELLDQNVYLRYMDDCLVISKSKVDSDILFEKLNSLHKAISFTKEEESNNALPFLDILITREHDKFVTTVHRKATFTGQYLHFQSFCSKKQKVNLIRTICHRAHMICSPELLQKEMSKIKDVFIKNGYPESLINRVIKLHNENCSEKPYGPEKLHVVLKLPYAGKASYPMVNRVKSITESAYFALKPRVIFTSKPLISLDVKDPMSYLDKSCIVYKFNCSCERIYIGQTTRHFKIRIKEHIPKCVEDYITGKNVQISKAVINAAKRSAISEHLINNASCAEKYNISMFSILKQCANKFDLIKMEAILIHLYKPDLCKQKEFDYSVALFN